MRSDESARRLEKLLRRRPPLAWPQVRPVQLQRVPQVVASR